MSRNGITVIPLYIVNLFYSTKELFPFGKNHDLKTSPPKSQTARENAGICLRFSCIHFPTLIFWSQLFEIPLKLH